jgi:hypothetical protein
MRKFGAKVFLSQVVFVHHGAAENAEAFIFFAHWETAMGKNNAALRGVVTAAV